MKMPGSGEEGIPNELSVKNIGAFLIVGMLLLAVACGKWGVIG